MSVGLVQSGGFAGLEMAADVRLADLTAVDADHTRGLAEQVLAEPAQTAHPTARDGFVYELTVSRSGAPDRQIVTHDGALTPAQRALIGALRPRLHPNR